MFELRSVERMFCKRIVAWVMAHVFSFSLPCSCAAVDKPDRCFPMVNTWHAIHRRLGSYPISAAVAYLPTVRSDSFGEDSHSFLSFRFCLFLWALHCVRLRAPKASHSGFCGWTADIFEIAPSVSSNLFFIVDFFCKLQCGNVSWEIIYLLANLFYS